MSLSWELGRQQLVLTEKWQHMKSYPGEPQPSFLDQRLDGNLLGLPQKLEEPDLLQGLQMPRLAALEEESRNLGGPEYQDHNICSQAS